MTYVLFYRDPNTSHDEIAEAGEIVERRGEKDLVRVWDTYGSYLEIEIPTDQIIPARTIWKIKGSPLYMDHKPLILGIIAAGFLYEYFING